MISCAIVVCFHPLAIRHVKKEAFTSEGIMASHKLFVSLQSRKRCIGDSSSAKQTLHTLSTARPRLISWVLVKILLWSINQPNNLCRLVTWSFQRQFHVIVDMSGDELAVWIWAQYADRTVNSPLGLSFQVKLSPLLLVDWIMWAAKRRRIWDGSLS